MNIDVIVISSSIILQLISAFIAVMIFLHARKRAVGTIILATIFLMTFRRGISLYRLLSENPIKIDLLAESTALIVSFLFLVGISYLFRLIREHQHIEEALYRSNEELEIRVKERTQDLEQSELKLKTLFQDANEGIFIMDSNGLIMDANQKVCDIYGFNKNELVGTSIKSLITEKYKQRFNERMVRLLEGESLFFETEHYRKNGSIAAIEASIKAIKIEGNFFINAFIRDITEKKKLRAQLLHAQKMESIGTLAGGIAHEFKNNLTVIQSFTDIILQENNLSSVIVKYIGIIEESVQKASQTVSHLLSFARKGEFEPVPLNINSIIELTVTMVSKLLQKNLSIKKELIEPLPHVVGDAIQIEQVFMNLIVNSRDAMPDGGEISIKTGIVDIEKCNLNIPATLRSGEYINIKVSDTGTGIAREHLSHIFDPFYTTKGKDQGTGLGLAIVYGIIKEHGGYITVESIVGQGTTFNIYLPVSKKSIKICGADQIIEYKRPETILVVDDELYILEVLRKTLLENGFNIAVYDNPLKCLDFFRANHEKIDIVITDIIMPEMDGFEFAANIINIKPSTKIILMTGFPDIDNPSAYSFMRKPFKPLTMLNLINELTDTGCQNIIQGETPNAGNE